VARRLLQLAPRRRTGHSLQMAINTIDTHGIEKEKNGNRDASRALRFAPQAMSQVRKVLLEDRSGERIKGVSTFVCGDAREGQEKGNALDVCHIAQFGRA